MERILLLISPDDSSFFLRKTIPPLSIGVLQNYLRNNSCDAISYDLNNPTRRLFKSYDKEKWYKFYDIEKVISFINDYNDLEFITLIESTVKDISFEDIDLVGISIGAGVSMFELHFGFILAKVISEKYKLPIVFGGNSMAYLYLFKDIYADLWEVLFRNFVYFIKGPGEKTLVKIIQDLQYKGHVELTDLKGAIYIQEGSIIANAEDIPTFCYPDYDGFDLKPYFIYQSKDSIDHEVQFYKWPFFVVEQVSDYYSFRINNKEDNMGLFIPYYFNYYCPYSCAFCTQSREEKSYPCIKDINLIIDDIQLMINKYKSNKFIFYNNTFNYSVSFVNEFCEKLIERKIDIIWSDCARINGLTENHLKLMYRAGCRKLIFGFETGSPKLLEYIDKKLKIPSLINILQLCKKHGIWADLEVIVGFPFEYEEDFYQTYDFLNENRDLINFFYPNKFFIVPESLLGRYPHKYNIDIIKQKDYKQVVKENMIMFKLNFQVNKKLRGNTMYHIYSFNELNGRLSNEIIDNTNDKFEKIGELQLNCDVFKECNEFLNNSSIKLKV